MVDTFSKFGKLPHIKIREPMRKARGFWNKEKCIKEARKYKTRSAFVKGSYSAYQRALKNKWLDDICKHMILLHKPKGFWTYDKILPLAKKCKTKKEFRKRYPNLRVYINRTELNGIQKILKISRKNKWTKQLCREEAIKYSTKTDFMTKSSSAYQACVKNKWVKELCKHMKIIGNKKLKCIYAFEFPDNRVYVGLTFNIEKREKRHRKVGPVAKHINKTDLQPLIKQLTKYIFFEKAIKAEGYWQRKYKREGWISLHTAPPGGIGGNDLKWTKEECSKEALKYFSRKEFYENCKNGYSAAQRKGYLKDICHHMVTPFSSKRKPIIGMKNNKKINFETIREAVSKLIISRYYIRKILKGEMKHYKGYTFKYA